MPRYVVLYKFTERGRKNARGTVEHARDVRKRDKDRGFEIHGLYWTQGDYDMVAIVEAPTEHAMMASLLAVGGAGNVMSTTLRAFDEEEMEEVLGVADNYTYDDSRVMLGV